MPFSYARLNLGWLYLPWNMITYVLANSCSFLSSYNCVSIVHRHTEVFSQKNNELIDSSQVFGLDVAQNWVTEASEQTIWNIRDRINIYIYIYIYIH